MSVASSRPPPPRAPSNPPALARVAVVDDDRLARDRVVSLLRARGHQVTAFESATRLLEAYKQAAFDLVLLDVVMEGMSGVEACRILKAREEGFVPVVLVTSRADPDARVEGLRIGADDYVCKPFEEEELLARVSSMLRIKRAFDQLAASRNRMAELAVLDDLTGLYNVRYLQQRFAEEWKRAERHREPLAIAMLDVDHFKLVNDQHGHDVGDAVLREVSTRLKGSVRDTDVVARYGGEEFVVLLPSTQLAGALVVAERIRKAIGSRRVETARARLDVTTSIGVALYPSRGVSSKDQLLRAADAALYRAKEEGRDRICVHQEQMYVFLPEDDS
ncbi:MAG: diguanylate cyclase [Sandaracinus sp.]